MRRAIVALVVTAAAVVWLASYRTHPPSKVNPQAALVRRPPIRATATATATPLPAGTRVGRGPLLTTPFSVIQVEATLTRGKLTAVRTVELTGSDTHTQALNARAEPILRREALQAGSADIDVVSGATYTSESWKESLQKAIEDAR
jgi:uncharacterized protein with FMN-binding domain